jgi:predicted nucleic acid-binding protein
MQVFDASSMIYAWDNYPIRQFPVLWDWMAEQIEEKNLVMPSVAFDEVANKTPDCGKWLEGNNLEQLEINNSILHDAMRIKRLLGIVADKYHAKGVGENDILIIATTRAHNAGLVSDEDRQPTTPREPSKRKIPAVCGMNEVNVPCINFIEFIKGSDEIFS